MADDTRVDRLITWFKNNPISAVLIFAAIAFLAVAKIITTAVEVRKALASDHAVSSPADALPPHTAMGKALDGDSPSPLPSDAHATENEGREPAITSGRPRGDDDCNYLIVGLDDGLRKDVFRTILKIGDSAQGFVYPEKGVASFIAVAKRYAVGVPYPSVFILQAGDPRGSFTSQQWRSIIIFGPNEFYRVVLDGPPHVLAGTVVDTIEYDAIPAGSSFHVSAISPSIGRQLATTITDPLPECSASRRGVSITTNMRSAVKR